MLGFAALLVDAIPAPVPEPAPEPIFGLGLLGRLLAAYSRGEKEEDFGNCKCNRRTFHTKEKEKDKVELNLTNLIMNSSSVNCRIVYVIHTEHL